MRYHLGLPFIIDGLALDVAVPQPDRKGLWEQDDEEEPESCEDNNGHRNDLVELYASTHL